MWPQTHLCSYHNLLSFYTAKTVLAKLSEEFVAEVNPSPIASDLNCDGNINDGTLTEIKRTSDRRQQSTILFDYLICTCTEESLDVVCNRIKNVQANASMQKFGEKLKEELKQGEWHVCVCVFPVGAEAT